MALKSAGKPDTMAQFMNAFNANTIEYQGLTTDAARLSELTNWLAIVLPATTLKISVASADASFRSYYRARSSERSWIIMDAPVTHEDTAPFRHVARLLAAAGVRVPQIYATAPELGFMLLEDFGNQTLLSVRGSDPARSERCYPKAIETLVKMQTDVPMAAVPAYGEARFRTEMELFRYWLVLRHLGLSWSVSDEKHWQATMTELVRDALSQQQVFVHRDYHSRNLMVMESDDPGVLDFQDAVAGPIFYDLVSLLKDCYIPLQTDWLERQLHDYFIAIGETPLAMEDTLATRKLFHSMGLQRHLKAAGIFARLWHRDGKDGYLPDIPATLHHIVVAAANDERFEWLAGFVGARVQPAFNDTAVQL